MNFWKTAGRRGAAVATAAVVAAFAPAVYGQAGAHRSVRTIEPFASQGSEIGVAVRDVDDNSTGTTASTAAGVLIEDVTPGSPAEAAGIRKGDVILEYDGDRVRSVRQFMRLVDETPPGRRVVVVLTRDARRTNVTVAPRASSGMRLLGEFDRLRALGEAGRNFDELLAAPPPPPPAPPAAGGAPSPPPPPPPPAPVFPDVEGLFWSPGTRLGLTVIPLTDQLAGYFGARHGVLVTAVAPDSAAHGAGFKAGDVVTALNGVELSAATDLRRATQRLQDGDEFSAEVLRDKKGLTLKGKYEGRRPRIATRVTL
jgi:serine protease Do